MDLATCLHALAQLLQDMCSHFFPRILYEDKVINSKSPVTGKDRKLTFLNETQNFITEDIK